MASEFFLNKALKGNSTLQLIAKQSKKKVLLVPLIHDLLVLNDGTAFHSQSETRNLFSQTLNYRAFSRFRFPYVQSRRVVHSGFSIPFGFMSKETPDKLLHL